MEEGGGIVTLVVVAAAVHVVVERHGMCSTLICEVWLRDRPLRIAMFPVVNVACASDVHAEGIMLNVVCWQAAGSLREQ